MGSKVKPDGTGMRFDNDKLRFDLLPPDALIALARVYHAGAQKYPEHNWSKGMKWSKVSGSLWRHWMKWSLGEKKDPETNCHHLAHVAWNALTLMIYELKGIGEDDRLLFEEESFDCDTLDWLDSKQQPLNKK